LHGFNVILTRGAIGWELGAAVCAVSLVGRCFGIIEVKRQIISIPGKQEKKR
jgi:hypothetical protein